MDIVVLVLMAVVVGFVVDLFVPKRAWAWLLTMLAAGVGGAAAGYAVGTVYPFIGNLSFWSAFGGALLAAIVVRLGLRLTQRRVARM